MVTERPRESSVSILRLLPEHSREQRQKSVNEFGTLLAQSLEALLS